MEKLGNYNEKKLQKDVKKKHGTDQKQVKMWRVNKHRKKYNNINRMIPRLSFLTTYNVNYV